MEVPALWHPFPDELDIWDRVFRVEIEYPLDGTPVVNGHIERTYDMRGKKVTEFMPAMQLSVPLTAILTDPELAPCMLLPLDQALRTMLYILWKRKTDAPVADLQPEV